MCVLNFYIFLVALRQKVHIQEQWEWYLSNIITLDSIKVHPHVFLFRIWDKRTQMESNNFD